MEKIKVILENNNEKITKEYNAIINNKRIIYKEDNCKVTLDYSGNLKLYRENEDYYISFEFIDKKKTKGFCKLKKENKILNLDILTNCVIIEEDLILIKYKVITTLENVTYRLEK